MCHGLIEQRASISVPDLLRNQCYEVADYDKKEEEEYPTGSGSSIDLSFIEKSVLPESSGLSECTLADIVNDYSSAVKKFDAEDVDIVEADALASTGSLSTWFDCIKEDFCSGADSMEADAKPNKPVKEDVAAPELATTKSRKARKSADKEQSHAHDDSEMDDKAPVLIDEKRKRRMSSNRASAQRSRQRKQERLDELEILTAQLRLENATLSRKSKMAELVAKKIVVEKNELAKKVEELRKELEAARHALSHHGSSDSGDDSNDSHTSGNLDSGVCDMVLGDELQTFPSGTSNNPENVATLTLDTRKRNVSSANLTSNHGIFQDLYDAIDSDQFEVCLGAEVTDLLQEEWYGSFTECLNAA